MPRVKGGVRHTRHREKILRHAKGFRWGRKSKIKLARVAVARKYRFAWEDRRNKRRLIRNQWHLTLGAALRAHDMKWSTFAPALKAAHIDLNRKMLVELAEHHPAVFLRVLLAVKPRETHNKSTPA